MSSPLYELEKGIYSKLTAESGLITALGGTAIWNSLAPISQDLPFVVFNHQAGGDENYVSSRSLNSIYVVKVISNSLAQAMTIDGHIDTALHDATISVTGYTNIWSRRIGNFRYTEVEEDGSVAHHVGGFYRFRITK